MRKLLTKIRGYGWYCTTCATRKDLDRVSVAKIVRNNYITVLCLDCFTELVDCFILDEINFPKKCEDCIDKFKCYTRADAVIEKPMCTYKSHEIKSPPIIKEIAQKIEGVRAYTGIYNDKLRISSQCAYPNRDDCNNSWMRVNYNGIAYKRCEYMKYDPKEKKWNCIYGI